MARNMYGATSADFTLTSGGRVVPSATLTIWSARTGGTQITDLLDVDSVATTTVTSDASGAVVYYGPNDDKTVHWADSGQGARVAIRPVDITGDPPVLSIGTVGTGTAAASLTGTSEAPVLNLTLPSAGANGVDTAAIQDAAVTAAKLAVQPGNLLSDNAASIETSAAAWTGYILTVARSTAQALHGSASLLVTRASGTGGSAYTPTGTSGVPVVAGQTYTATASFRAATGTPDARVAINWYTSGGSLISQTVNAYTATSSSWRTEYLTAVAPATAAYAGVEVQMPTGTAGDAYYADALGLWRGAAGVWQLPGAPIPGQSRIAVNNAVDLSGTGSPEGVVVAAPGSTWLQTDATNDVKGWIKWVKATGTGNTGWVAGPEADTGWRLVSSWGTDGVITNSGVALTNITAKAATAGSIKVRRIGNRVRWRIVGAVCASGAKLDTIASGFMQTTGTIQTVPLGRNVDTAGAAGIGASAIFLPAHTTDDAYATTWEAPVDGTNWPTSLPGSSTS